VFARSVLLRGVCYLECSCLEEAATIGLRPALAASSDGFVFFEGVNVAGFPSLYALVMTCISELIVTTSAP